VNLVEDYPFSTQTAKKLPGVFHLTADARKLAVKILHSRERLTKECLADTADA
jgi:hypothetical protein